MTTLSHGVYLNVKSGNFKVIVTLLYNLYVTINA